MKQTVLVSRAAVGLSPKTAVRLWGRSWGARRHHPHRGPSCLPELLPQQWTCALELLHGHDLLSEAFVLRRWIWLDTKFLIRTSFPWLWHEDVLVMTWGQSNSLLWSLWRLSFKSNTFTAVFLWSWPLWVNVTRHMMYAFNTYLQSALQLISVLLKCNFWGWTNKSLLVMKYFYGWILKIFFG